MESEPSTPAVNPKRKYQPPVSDADKKRRKSEGGQHHRIYLAQEQFERWMSLRKDLSSRNFVNLLLDSYESRLLSNPLLDSRAGTRFNYAACGSQNGDSGSVNGTLPSSNSQEHLVKRTVNKSVHVGPLNMECSSDSEVETDEECHINSEMDSASQKLDGKNEPVAIGTDTLPIHMASPSPSDIVCGPGGLETNDSVAKLNGNIDASHLVVGDSVCKVKEEPETGPDYLLYSGCTGSQEMNSVYNPTENHNSTYDYRYFDNVAGDPNFNPKPYKEFTSKKDKLKVHKRPSTPKKYFILDDGKNSKCELKFQPYLEVIFEPEPLPATSDRSESSALNVCVEKSPTDVSAECPLKSNPCEDGELCKHLSVDDKVIDKDRIPDTVEGAKPVVKYRCTACGYVLKNLFSIKQHIRRKEIATSNSDDNLGSDELQKGVLSFEEFTSKKDKRKVHKRRPTTGNYYILDDGKNSRCELKFQPYIEVIFEPCPFPATLDSSESSVQNVCVEKSTTDTECPLKSNPCEDGELCKHLSVDHKVIDKDRIPDMIEGAKPVVKYRCSACGNVWKNLFSIKQHIRRKEIATSDSRDYKLESAELEIDVYSDNDFESMEEKGSLKVKTRKLEQTDCTDSIVDSDEDEIYDQYTQVGDESRKGNSPMKANDYFFLDDGKNSKCLLKFRKYLGILSEPSELTVSGEDLKSDDALAGSENSASNINCEFLAKSGPTDKETKDDGKLLVKDEIGASNLESNNVVAKAKKRVTYQCLACGLTSISLRHMKKHITRVEIYDPQVCRYCGEVSHSTHALSLHEAEHTGKKVVKTKSYLICPYEGCSRKAGKPDEMRRHISAVHLNERKHVCSWADCEKRFNSPHALEVHMRIHTDSKPIVCYLCGYRCRQKASLNWHMKSKHPQAALPKVLN